MDFADYIQIKGSPFTCDCCGEECSPEDRRYVLQPRPSEPDTLVAVMWTCPACASQVGAMTLDEAERFREANGYLFLEA